MNDQTPQPRALMRRSLRMVLFASLAVNLVVIGLAAGAVLGNKKGENRPARDADFMGAFTRALPEDDRRIIGRAIRDHHKKSGISREAAREEFQLMLTIIRTAPLDSEGLNARISKQAQSSFDRRLAAQLIWLERVQSMTDAERQDYADQIEAHLMNAAKNKKKRQD